MSAAETAPNGGCFNHPISGPNINERWCGQPAVATIVMLDEQDHPDWRACEDHAKECDSDDPLDNNTVRVEWDSGGSPGGSPPAEDRPRSDRGEAS